jgi:hypothetical protein
MITASFGNWRCALRDNPAGWGKGYRYGDNQWTTAIQCG